MTTPKKIIIQDLELADKEIARLRKENKELKIELGMYQNLFKDKIEPYGCGIYEKVTEEDVEKAIKEYLNTNQK